jgi:hypothetical protein
MAGQQPAYDPAANPANQQPAYDPAAYPANQQPAYDPAAYPANQPAPAPWQAQPQAAPAGQYAQPGQVPGQVPGQNPAAYQAAQPGQAAPAAWYPSGQQAPAAQPGQPAQAAWQGQPFDPNLLVPKKKSKLPLIAAIAVIVVLLVGGGVAFALFNPFGGNKSAIASTYDGTEKLAFDVSSATVDVSAAGANMQVQWTLGKDLRSSSFLVAMTEPEYAGGDMTQGYLLKDDRIYEWYDYGDGDIEVDEYTGRNGIVSELNEAFEDEYGISIDFNRLVNNGKFDRGYLEEIGKKLEDIDLGGSYYGFSSSDYDEGLTKIGEDFFQNECNKEEVWKKFILDLVTSDEGGTRTYSFSFDAAAFIEALGDFAASKAQGDLKDAGTTLADACDELVALAGKYLDPFDMTIKIKDGILVGAEVSVSTNGISVKVELKVTGINSTNLNDDSRVRSIIDNA